MQMATKPAYVYAATVVRVHDGDTLDVDVDLGFHVAVRPVPIRLLGCNAAELGTPGGDAAAAHLAAMLPAGTPLVIETVQVDKYGGRWDAAVILAADGADLVAELIAGQWAAPWTGAGPKPVPPWPRTITSDARR